MGRRRHLPAGADPRVTMAAFDRAMLSGDAEAERALSAIASVPYLDDDEDEPDDDPAKWAALSARLAEAEAEMEARGGPDYDAAAAAALAPLPDIDLSDAVCIDVAALLSPYVSEDQ